MNCPVCSNVQLVMSDRQGIEIDYCPQCRGVWLDRGELDKVIERSLGGSSSQRFDQENRGRSQDYKNSEHRERYQEGHYKKKRGGFLSDLFDFD